MNFLNSGLGLVLFFSLILNLNSKPKLSLKWGLESTQYFRETKITRDGYFVEHPDVSRRDKLYRYFTPNSNYNEITRPFFERHTKLWEEFESSPAKAGQTKLDFINFVKEKDPYYLGIVKKLTPQLYFDFIGETKEYVLESIEVTTILFDQYKGGGFSLNEAWYDIELKHIPGKYHYPVESKLKFTGSGRCILRLCSDNYDKTKGMTPSGLYIINIKFNFLVNGEKKSVETGEFQIDV